MYAVHRFARWQPLCAVSLMTLILLRGRGSPASSPASALRPLCGRSRPARGVWLTPYSVLLFHPMKWQSEEHVGLAEAAEWSRHFGQLEKDMDSLLAELFGLPVAEMEKWIVPGRYVSGRETGRCRSGRVDRPAEDQALRDQRQPASPEAASLTKPRASFGIAIRIDTPAL